MTTRRLFLVTVVFCAVLLCLFLLLLGGPPREARRPSGGGDPSRGSAGGTGSTEALPDAPRTGIPAVTAVAAPAGGPARADAAAPGRVRGRVTMDGGALGEVVVSVARYAEAGDSPDLPNYFEMRLPSGGEFAFDGLYPGAYGLSARPAGLPDRQVDFVVSPGGETGPIEIAYPRAGTLRVLVLDRSGKAAAGAFVNARGGEPEWYRSGRTDAEGRISFEPLLPGYWIVMAAMSGAGEESRGAQIEPGGVVEVVFGGGTGFTGLVIGPDGQPLPGAIVYLLASRREAGAYVSLKTETGSDGRFWFAAVEAGEYRARIQVRGKRPYVAPAGRVTVTAGDAGEIRLVVPATSLSGRIVKAETKEPVGREDVQITAEPVDPQAGDTLGPGGMVWITEDGRYEFVGLSPGRWHLWIASLRYRSAQVSRDVDLPDSGRLEGVDFELPVPKD